MEFGQFPRMTWHDAMKYYGSDKPDIRFGMRFVELNDVVKGKGFGLFDNAELVVGICAEGCSEYTRKQLDQLTDFVKRPQVGAGGMVYVKYNTDGTFKSSVDKFYTPDDLKVIADKFGAKPGRHLEPAQPGHAGRQQLERGAVRGADHDDGPGLRLRAGRVRACDRRRPYLRPACTRH